MSQGLSSHQAESGNLRAAQSFAWVGMEGEVTGSGDGPGEGMDASVGRLGNEDRNQHGHQSIGTHADLDAKVSCCKSLRMPSHDNGERPRPMDALAPEPQRSGRNVLTDRRLRDVEHSKRNSVRF